MNEKFFDLKKEKQDRMINGALKVFAASGYAHASTDEIVKEAGISKGLLFHYFISKLGLYTFVYDYSVRYLLLELSTGVSPGETDYFELLLQIKQAQLGAMKNYPHILQFLNRSREEDVEEVLTETEDKRGVLPGRYEEIVGKADLTKFKRDTDVERVGKVLQYTMDGILAEQSRSGSFRPGGYYEEVKQYLAVMKKLSYHERQK